MWTGLFGNKTAEKVLIYLGRFDEGYARSIALIYGLPVSQIQRQLQRLESAGVLVSQLKGRTRYFLWNPRCYFLNELRAVLSKMIQHLPATEQEKYLVKRTRPRRTGKPL